MFSQKDIKQFFDVVLKGESKTYNDHNYYTSSSLKGYVEGSFGSKYSLLNKKLSDYTIGEIKKFQSRSRDSKGQLWATGRYQIIPDTLIGITQKAGVSDNEKYNEKNQDKLALQLLLNRSSIRDYITQKIPDTKENLERASLSMAKIWSSIGVPYSMQGSNKWISKNESYYSGGGDKATVSTESVQNALKKLRSSFNKNITQSIKKSNSGIYLGVSIITVVLIAGGVFTYLAFKNPSKLPKFMK